MKQFIKNKGFICLIKKQGTLLMSDAKKKLAFSACFSFVFTLVLYIGRPIYTDFSLPSRKLGTKSFSFIEVLAIFLLATIILYMLFAVFGWLSRKNNEFPDKLPRRVFVFFWLGTVVTCTISWLAFYPGISTYDLRTQVVDSYAGFSNYNLHHPWLHTLLIEISIKIAEALDILAVSVYGMGQVIAICTISTFMLWYISKRTSNKFLLILSALYLLFNPVILIFSIIPIKDVCFAMVLGLTVIEIDRMNCDINTYIGKKMNWVVYAGLVLLCCLFRNNAIYAFAMLAPIQIIVYRNNRISMAIMTLLPLVLAYSINSYICPEIIGMERGEAKEALCVPMIQLTTPVYNGEELSDEDKAFLATYFEMDKIKEVYNPRNADGVKYNFSDEAYLRNKGEFWRGWLRMFGEYPREYIESFLSLNSSYWYILSDGLDRLAGINYIEVSNNPNERNNTKAPHALKIFEGVADYSLFEKGGGLCSFFKISVPIWILLFFCSVIMYLGNYRSLLCVAPLLLVYITFLAGPLSNIRYIFYFYYLFPLILAITCSKLIEKAQ